MEVKSERFPAFSSKLRVYVRDCQWAIFQTWETATNKLITEMSDDGTNIYVLEHQEARDAGASATAAEWPVDPFSWLGEIHPSGFPYRRLNTEIGILFYAYASSCYLDSLTNEMIGLT